ncbi:DNA primase [Streptomyces griseofuscus]|uniref:DNA primase n=1 Tax=Streptomyces griseofuscus TaxID=146922 RepID=A0A3R8RZQ9_9ACTN|nr:DNA primase [Streptomyces griseofuscus]RRQ76136.1 DNA primase [Streptomyces griseofuscus]RRQ84434.1 DNA primase [Streptomyces griseofuscus]
MNRTALGLAIGAGYFLGRTRKLKMAIAVGSLVAGKKLNLGPGALVDLARQQLRDNPQFKEIGEQLRTDLRGVGKAASGAMVERQMSTLADRLHDRTAQVRGELPGADESDDESDESPEAGRDDEDRTADRGDEPDGDGGSTPKPRAQKPAAKKTAARRTGTTEKTGPAKRKTAAKKTGAQRQTAAKKPAGSRGGGSAKGGDER